MYCILVAGIPASGKTNFAKQLSKYLNIPVVSKDEIKEILFDTVGFHSRKEKVALGVGSMDSMYYFAESLMKVGLPFILENNFENTSKADLQKLIEVYKYQTITVLLDGDIEVIYNRFVERDISPSRHRGHVVNTEYPETLSNPEPIIPIGLEAFEKKITERGMRNFVIGDNLIKVDCTDYDKLDYKVVNKQLKTIIHNINA
jgi:predicted kinase